MDLNTHQRIAELEHRVAGLREAVSRWKAKAQGHTPPCPIVEQDYDGQTLKTTWETLYPADLHPKTVWALLKADPLQRTGFLVRLRSRRGVWLAIYHE